MSRHQAKGRYFCYHHVCTSEPFRITLINVRVYSFGLCFQTHVRLADMFCQDHVRLLDVGNHPLIESSVSSSATDGPAKYIFLFISPLV